MQLRFHHLSLVRCGWEIHHHHYGIALGMSKPKEAILFVLCPPVSIFATHLSLGWSRRERCVNSIEINMNVLKLRSLWPAKHFTLDREHIFVRPSQNIYTIFLQFLYSSNFGRNCAHIIHENFRSTHVLNFKKHNNANIIASGVVNRRTQETRANT
jgi:hypothetical protein